MISSGLRIVPYRTAERVRQLAGLSEAEMASFLGVSDRTYDRRAAAGELSEAESVKVEFLEGALDLAAEVFGDEADARRWMKSELPVFGGRTPLQMLDGVRGYETVKDELNRIRFGMF